MAEEIPAVGATAFWIAGMRMEATRDGNPAVLNDPYAEKLLKAGEGEKHFAEFRKCGGVPGFIVFWLLELLIFPMWSIFNDLKLGRPWRGVLTSLKNAFRVLTCTPYSYTLTEHVRRTKFLDDIVTAGVAPARRDDTPRCEQVVVLGAGLDTRAWRLAIPSATLFIEVDHPSIFAHKEPIMEQHKPSCKRVALGLDYDQVGNWHEHAAQRATFNSAKATVFVLEGLTMYLKDDEQDALFASLGKTAAPGSVVAGDTYTFPGAPGPKETKGLLLNSLRTDRLTNLLEKNGFKVEQLVLSSSDELRYGGPALPTWDDYPDYPCMRTFFRATKK